MSVVSDSGIVTAVVQLEVGVLAYLLLLRKKTSGVVCLFTHSIFSGEPQNNGARHLRHVWMYVSVVFFKRVTCSNSYSFVFIRTRSCNNRKSTKCLVERLVEHQSTYLELTV